MLFTRIHLNRARSKVFVSCSILAFYLSSGCSHLFYYPQKYLIFSPKLLDLEPTPIYVSSKDGTRIHGWHFKADPGPPKGVVLQFHGNAENISSHYLQLVWLIQKGYDTVFFDYRGYGSSEGVTDQKGAAEDGAAVIQFTLDRIANPRHIPLTIIGQSLGGAIAPVSFSLARGHYSGQIEQSPYSADRSSEHSPKQSYDIEDDNVKQTLPKNIGAANVGTVSASTASVGALNIDPYANGFNVPLLVLDSTFHSYKAIARNLLSRSLMTWLFQPLAYVLVSDEMSPDEYLPDIRPTKTIVVHGTDDNVVDISLGQKVFELASEPKEFWTVDRGRHIEAFVNPNSPLRLKLVNALDVFSSH